MSPLVVPPCCSLLPPSPSCSDVVFWFPWPHSLSVSLAFSSHTSAFVSPFGPHNPHPHPPSPLRSPHMMNIGVFSTPSSHLGHAGSGEADDWTIIYFTVATTGHAKVFWRLETGPPVSDAAALLFAQGHHDLVALGGEHPPPHNPPQTRRERAASPFPSPLPPS